MAGAPTAQGGGSAQVRLIGGRWRRSVLPVLDRPGLRPTGSRVRETLFNWLGADLQGLRCVDAFAGTGALGLEAASRGAQTVCLIESDPGAARQLEQTVARLAGSESVRVLRGDALRQMQRLPQGQWDLVFLDPPFAQDLWRAALDAARGLLAPGGWVYAEQPAGLPWPLDTGWDIVKESRVGAVAFALLQVRAPGDSVK